ncbi:hypothetical protein A2Y83_03985 [Candidatus Falkowbacteria bacterium RBG_13_39_14]|uniref:histidine kinase n=1 Tax=Candidatus Falkowbacteria bacterium RBG_13_39_14 TaxID=1797985 RepID=A0A1F5S7W0_9BACT|nr:MAG: hypothetical protein A2Y83_03985 [Candidatus Falkowbacteria bacterium RBG_13_39_14]
MPPFLSLIVLFFFLGLYLAVRKKYLIISFYSFIAVLFFTVTYGAYIWGVNLPAALLAYALVIIIGTILIGTGFGIIATTTISSIIILLGFLQIHNVVIPNLYWKNEVMKKGDLLVYILMLGVIMVVSWLSNREIEKSLKRARRSEAELKKERDMLEIKVEERTRELKKMQMEKIAQLYRHAEFGRLASGLFHDLMSPLTAVSLSLEEIKKSTGAENEIAGVKSYLAQAIEVARKMENFIIAIRKQISHKESKDVFSLTEEIIQVIQILSYKARKKSVELEFSGIDNIENYGDRVKFSQIIINLISNAIDAYESLDKEGKVVGIRLSEKEGNICLEIEDKGCGIERCDKNRIFDPFFTTKGFEKGTGIGLSTTKGMIENDFGGTIEVESEKGRGAKFIVRMPKRTE